MNMMDARSEKNYGFKALIPLLVFLVLFVGCGAYFSIKGVEEPFEQMSRYVAVLIGIVVALLCFDTHKSVGEKIKVYYGTAGNSSVMLICFVVLMASAFSGAVKATGGMNAIINLGISLIPTHFLAPGIFLMCAILSLIVGTNLGTATLMAPIAAALVEGTTMHPGLAAAAVITGVNFGDNISIISDNTIIATSGVGAEPRNKFLMNMKIALPAAILTALVYAFLGRDVVVANNVATAAGEYNLLTGLPYILVLILGATGANVILVLLSGMGLSCVIGMLTGTATFWDWAKGVSSGMEGVFWLVAFAVMLSGLTGYVRYYGGMDWLLEKAKNGLKTSRSTEYLIFFLPMIIAAIISNNPLAILICAPVVKDLGERYDIGATRLACLLDIGACIGPMIMPHGTIMLLVTGTLATTFVDTLRFEFYTLFLAITTILIIQFTKNKAVKAK